jgi:hypothetical protein
MLCYARRSLDSAEASELYTKLSAVFTKNISAGGDREVSLADFSAALRDVWAQGGTGVSTGRVGAELSQRQILSLYCEAVERTRAAGGNFAAGAISAAAFVEVLAPVARARGLKAGIKKIQALRKASVAFGFKGISALAASAPADADLTPTGIGDEKLSEESIRHPASAAKRVMEVAAKAKDKDPGGKSTPAPPAIAKLLALSEQAN